MLPSSPGLEKSSAGCILYGCSFSSFLVMLDLNVPKGDTSSMCSCGLSWNSFWLVSCIVIFFIFLSVKQVENAMSRYSMFMVVYHFFFVVGKKEE